MPEIRIATKNNKSDKIDKTCVIQIDTQSPGNGWFVYLETNWSTPYRYSFCFKTKLLAFKYIRKILPLGETVRIEDRTHHYVRKEKSYLPELTYTSEYYYITKPPKDL